MAARSECARNATQGCGKAYRLRRIARHRATCCGAEQLTGAFACKCAYDLLYRWAEMPEVDVSDDMVMSSSINNNFVAESCGKGSCTGADKCRASTSGPGINSVQT